MNPSVKMLRSYCEEDLPSGSPVSECQICTVKDTRVRTSKSPCLSKGIRGPTILAAFKTQLNVYWIPVLRSAPSSQWKEISGSLEKMCQGSKEETSWIQREISSLLSSTGLSQQCITEAHDVTLIEMKAKLGSDHPIAPVSKTGTCINHYKLWFFLLKSSL